MQWYILAILSSVIWGLGYTLSERVFKHGIDPSLYMAFTGVVYIVISGVLASFFVDWKQQLPLLSSGSVLVLMAITGCCYAIGALLIYHASAMKNASLANMIEISYPLFTILFAYLLFNDVQMNFWTWVGAVFVLAGVGIVILGS